MMTLRFNCWRGASHMKVIQQLKVESMERATIPSGAFEVLVYANGDFVEHRSVPGRVKHCYASQFGIVFDE